MTKVEGSGMEYYFEIQQHMKRALSWETSCHWRSETGGNVTFKKILKGDWDSFNININIYGIEILEVMKDSIRQLN